MDDTAEKKTPRDLLRVIFRHWRLFLLGASLFAIAALLGSHYIPVRYTGSTIFERRSDPASDQMSRSTGASGGFGPLKLTLQHELGGYHAVARAMEELGMTRGMPRGPDGQLTLPSQMAKQELVRKLIEDLEVKWEVRSDRVDLISVSFTHRDSALAERMPNTLVRNYINWVSEQIIERLGASREFLLKQVNGCTSRLDELTKQRLEFETEHAGMLPDSPGSLQERIQRVSADMDTLRRQRTLAELKVARLKSLIEPATESTDQPMQIVKGPNPELKRLQDQLQKFQDELDSALTLSHMTDKHPTVQTLRAKITQLEERIKETPEETVLQSIYGTDSVPLDLVTQLAAAQSELEMSTNELERLQGRLAAYQTLMDNFGPVRQKYLWMIQRQEELQAEANRWQQRLTEVQMALAAEVAKRRTHLNTVQVAQKQFRPSSPTLRTVFILVIGGGLAFGAGLVFVANSLDRSITTTDDAAEHFGVPILGVIGEIVTSSQRAVRRLKRWVIGPILSLIVLLVLGISVLSVVLWLQYPEQYKQWKASPSAFIYNGIAELSKD